MAAEHLRMMWGLDQKPVMMFLKLVIEIEIIKAGVAFYFWRHSSGKLEGRDFKGTPPIRTFCSLSFNQCLCFCFERGCREEYLDALKCSLALELRMALHEQNLQGQPLWDFASFLYRILCLYWTLRGNCVYAASIPQRRSVTYLVLCFFFAIKKKKIKNEWSQREIL